jgi:plastocyanin
MAPTRSVLLAAGVLLLAGAGCRDRPEPSTTDTAPEGGVLVRNTAYNPNRIEVPVGKEVVWTFDDPGPPHTVTADDYSFTSSYMKLSEFRHTFDAPGEYAYHCEVHARMKGTVVVTG